MGKSEPGRPARYQEEAEGRGHWAWAGPTAVALMTEAGSQRYRPPSSGTQWETEELWTQKQGLDSGSAKPDQNQTNTAKSKVKHFQ